jgi:hypothetical protein
MLAGALRPSCKDLIAPRDVRAENLIAQRPTKGPWKTFPDTVEIAGLIVEMQLDCHTEVCLQDVLSYHLCRLWFSRRDLFAFAAPYKGARCKTAKALSLAVQLQTAKVTAKEQI